MQLASKQPSIERTKRVLREIEAALEPSVLAPEASDQETVETVRRLTRRAARGDFGADHEKLEATMAAIERLLAAPSTPAEKIDALWTLLDDGELHELLAQPPAA